MVHWYEFLLILLSIPIVVSLVFLSIPLRRPWKTESDYSYPNTPWWQIYYCHKYLWIRDLPERGSGLKKYFDNVRFDPPSERLANSKNISIKSVGDIMCRQDFVNGGGEDLYDEIGEYLFDADITMGNLEFSVNDKVFIKKLLQFAVPESWADVLIKPKKFEKFDYLSLGNNHINDSLSSGVHFTCDYLDSLGIQYSGASRNSDEADQFPIFDINGSKIALLSYTFSTNGVPLETNNGYQINVIRFNAIHEKDYDDSLIRKHVDLAKERGADYIISSHHWGVDLEYYPPSRIVQRAHDLFEYGVDLILGHHSHVVGPLDVYNTSDGRQCVALYSLGNFTSTGLVFPKQRVGYIFEVKLETGQDLTGKSVTRPSELILTPIYHRRASGEFKHRIIPINQGSELIESGNAPSDYSRKDCKVLPSLRTHLRKLFHFEGVGYR